jgi:hypothetical protein
MHRNLKRTTDKFCVPEMAQALADQKANQFICV